MKRLLTIILVSALAFGIAFFFLWMKNEEFANNLIDEATLNTRWIRENRPVKVVENTGGVLTGEMQSWSVFSWVVMTGSATTGGTGWM